MRYTDPMSEVITLRFTRPQMDEISKKASEFDVPVQRYIRMMIELLVVNNEIITDFILDDFWKGVRCRMKNKQYKSVFRTEDEARKIWRYSSVE